MKNSLIKLSAVIATAVSFGTTVPVMADTTASNIGQQTQEQQQTQAEEKEETITYKQSLSELESKITVKLDKMEFNNSTSKSDIKNKAEDCIRDSSEYSIDVEDFEKEEATRSDTGSISCTLIITDQEDNETKMEISRTLEMIKTNVYLKLPELEGKYTKVTNQDIIDDVTNNKGYDKDKYLVTDESLANSKILGAGWQNIDGAIYYIDEVNGIKKGWQEIDGEQYHFDETTGKAKTLWEFYNNKWYFMDADGKVLTGFKTIDDVTYYLAPLVSSSNDVLYTGDMSSALPSKGAMAIGWKQITGQWYYFNSNGSMAKGWKQLGGYWYYFDDNGVMLSNTIVDGYKLAESGEWVY